MFENVNPNNQEPEDMFDKAGSMPQVAPPTPAVLEEPVEMPEMTRRGLPWKPLLIVFAIFLVVVSAAMISYYILSSRTPVVPQEPATGSEENAGGEVTTPTAPVTPAVPVDTDKDGLTDEAEATLGTNPNNPDTDDDGLADREEVEVYKTNSLVADTDEDGFADGTEVSNGYNPNGEGKLFSLPQ